MAKTKKDREEIPKDVAARVLFLSDRTCCVCRTRGKPVQIHHIDEDPSNNTRVNLAVLCFDCHRDTQIRGGFDRKLDADQVHLYRDDWLRLVVQQRARDEAASSQPERVGVDIELATTVAEIYRDADAFDLLAMHYHHLGNDDLRDKYVEKAIAAGLPDSTLVFLRGLQGRPAEIPGDVVARMETRLSEQMDSLQLGRLYTTLERYHEAAAKYLEGIQDQLRRKRYFTAAFYLKELSESTTVDELFILALKDAEAEGSFWWQIRALQELGWDDEVRDLVLQNEADIIASDDLPLNELLAQVKGDRETYRDIRKQVASAEAEVEYGDDHSL
jgi:hypothetical protein